MLRGHDIMFIILIFGSNVQHATCILSLIKYGKCTFADPEDVDDEYPGFSFSRNNPTGAFGGDVTDAFLALNNLKCIVRSHQEELSGHRVDHNGKCITVFSAPNYMHDGANTGAVLRYADPLTMVPEIVQFEAEHYKTHRNLTTLRSCRDGRWFTYYA